MKRFIPMIMMMLLFVPMFVGCECKHEFTETITKEATCAMEGEKVKTCSNCDMSETVTIEKTIDHKFTETVTKEATCAAEGEKTRTCSVCNLIETIATEKTTDHEFEETITKKATCAAEGEKVKTCSICSLSETSVIKKTTDHEYKDVEVIKEATCATAGSKKVVCVVCNKTQTVVIDKTDSHSTGLGKCDICGQVSLSLKYRFETIEDKSCSGIDTMNECLSYIRKGQDSANTQKAIARFKKAKGQFNEALNACGSHAEFKKVKSDLEVIVRVLENTDVSNPNDYMVSYRMSSATEKILPNLKSLLNSIEEISKEIGMVV